MKHLMSIIVAVLLFAGSAEAQRLRLGDRTPDIAASTTLGTSLDDIAHDYVCLAFVHSDSTPCVDAIDRLRSEVIAKDDNIAIVLLTAEEPTTDNELLNAYVGHNSSVAFDHNNHTFNAFGVSYVPFGVIFDKKRHRIEWFGSLQHIDREVIQQILK